MAPVTNKFENRSPAVSSIRNNAERAFFGIGIIDDEERQKARCERYELEYSPQPKKAFKRKGK